MFPMSIARSYVNRSPCPCARIPLQGRGILAARAGLATGQQQGIGREFFETLKKTAPNYKYLNSHSRVSDRCGGRWPDGRRKGVEPLWPPRCHHDRYRVSARSAGSELMMAGAKTSITFPWDA
jgi:hypothetical protein